MTAAPRTRSTSGTGSYVAVNGIELYVEEHGEGSPLVLLHGGLGSGEMFGPVLTELAFRHRVILPDLQGHGRTADIDRPIDLRLMADDIAGLIEHLGLQRPDVVGYSLGGGVALQLAARHPGSVGRLVLACAAVRRSAHYPELLAQQEQVSGAAAQYMVDTPMYQLVQRVAPRPEDFPQLLDKIGAAMGQDFDYSDQVRALSVPTLVVGADADLCPPAHFVETFSLLGGGQRDGGWMGEGRPEGGHALAVLPGLTHYSLCSSPLFATAVTAFLDPA